MSAGSWYLLLAALIVIVLLGVVTVFAAIAPKPPLPPLDPTVRRGSDQDLMRRSGRGRGPT